MGRDLRVRDLIIGTMKSAKSAQLIMKGYLLDEQGKKVVTFKPEADTRDGAFVSSRALPVKRSATVVPKDDNGTMMSTIVWTERPDVILLDELQFFTVKQVETLAKISITHDVDIYAYGLMMAYNGTMFEPIKRALECGFRMQTIDMSCDYCNNDATHHALYLDGVLQTEGESVNVEDFNNKEQVYKSVCYSCYQREIVAHKLKQTYK
ncbi:hypothetical protein [Bacillus phage PK-3]|nr:hypothetical protein [Bacillus phage PK-3]